MNYSSKNFNKEFESRARRKSRGIKTTTDRHHNLQVLYETNMPSVLVECGFLSNKSEENYLNSSYGQEILASAIFRAILSMIYFEYPELKNIESQVTNWGCFRNCRRRSFQCKRQNLR